MHAGIGVGKMFSMGGQWLIFHGVYKGFFQGLRNFMSQTRIIEKKICNETSLKKLNSSISGGTKGSHVTPSDAHACIHKLKIFKGDEQANDMNNSS